MTNRKEHEQPSCAAPSNDPFVKAEVPIWEKYEYSAPNDFVEHYEVHIATSTAKPAR